MTPITKPTRITHAMTGEIRIRRMGPNPGQNARVALMTSEGASVSVTHLMSFSAHTLKLIDMLCKSVEQDYVEMLEVQEIPPEDGVGAEEDPDEGVDFR